MWHGNPLATANALKPTIRATLLNYLHFPQALMIPPFSVLYLTVVYRTASCALLGFFQVWRPAFEVRSKILFYLRIPDQLFQRECFIWLTILFSMPHHTFLHGNGERKCSGKLFGPKLPGGSSGRVSAPSVVGRLTEAGRRPQAESHGGLWEWDLADLGVSTSRHSVRNGLLAPRDHLVLRIRSLTFWGVAAFRSASSPRSGPELQRAPERSAAVGPLAQEI